MYTLIYLVYKVPPLFKPVGFCDTSEKGPMIENNMALHVYIPPLKAFNWVDISDISIQEGYVLSCDGVTRTDYFM